MKSAAEAQVFSITQPESNASTLELEEIIRKRAFELYEQRKRGNGHDVEDWLNAEAELKAQTKAA